LLALVHPAQKFIYSQEGTFDPDPGLTDLATGRRPKPIPVPEFIDPWILVTVNPNLERSKGEVWKVRILGSKHPWSIRGGSGNYQKVGEAA